MTTLGAILLSRSAAFIRQRPFIRPPNRAINAAGNPSAAGTSAVIAVEAIDPTPGIVINRRAVGSDFAMQLRQLAAIEARQHDRAARMARRRGDKPVDQTRGLYLIAPAERLDDTLHVAATLAGVLDEVDQTINRPR